MLQGKILITGGAGYLGRAILKRAHEEHWDAQFTIFSTDAMKHHYVKSLYPDVHSVIGDIRDGMTVRNAMAGKDIVIHAAAVKHIPESEYHSLDTYAVNVEGSINVAMAAIDLNIPHVLAISTDKVCHAANAYGASKYMMEKTWQELARLGLPTQFHLVRYGNVLESTGSVIEVWKNAFERGEKIKITDQEMTRFWLAPSTAVQYVIESLKLNSGEIYVAKMPALSIGDLARYTLGVLEYDKVPLRPGEKMHETLLTIEECAYAMDKGKYFILRPTTSERNHAADLWPYTSDSAPQLTKQELMELLNG